MKKLLAVIVASTFALGSASGFAADAVKKDELTPEQRVEMRDRAAKLEKERAQAPTKEQAAVKHTVNAKQPHVKKAKKVTGPKVKKTAPAA